ncbi:MAG: GNAT family N-acetyltransferase [Cyanobacteria bacterium J06598_1]
MIRLATPNDKAALMDLAGSVELFEPDELATVDDMLTDYFEGSDEHFWLADEEDQTIVGAAYCVPERMTSGTWNLLFIGIHPTFQGQGRGSAIVSHVEQLLTEKGAHQLLIETLASFEQTRSFYQKIGYQEEAIIRDFYGVGADKIVYRKSLLASK